MKNECGVYIDFINMKIVCEETAIGYYSQELEKNIEALEAEGYIRIGEVYCVPDSPEYDDELICQRMVKLEK